MEMTRGNGNLKRESGDKSSNQWDFQDPKLEVPTIYNIYYIRPM